jgi:hypothetical protein
MPNSNPSRNAKYLHNAPFYQAFSRKTLPLDSTKTLFEEGHTVRQVAKMLGVSKSEAGRLRQRAMDEGLFDSTNGDGDLTNINGSEVAA